MAITIQSDQSKKNKRITKLLWGGTIVLWCLLTMGITVDMRINGKIPADCATYFHALEQFNNNISPYSSPEESQEIWQDIHTQEEQILAGTLHEIPGDKISGPFLYPPTLLQLMDLIKITPKGFMVWLLGMLILFSWLWFKVSKIPAWWLLIILFSWDVLASYTLGNIEIILLGSTLLSAYWLYNGRPVWAAPLIAFVIVVKPFYMLFFAALGLFMLAANPKSRAVNWRSLLIGASASIVLLIIFAALWPEWLRPIVFEYLQEGIAHSWYTLPLADQSPMSMWNRTFMQGLINLGISAKIAQTSSLLVWCIITGITISQIWKRSLPFPLLFAFSLLLFYWFRPVGWGLIFLDLIVLSAVWPYTSTKEKRWLLVGAILLALSHWIALILTGKLLWLRFVTIQSASIPWETWLVFPACWIILLVGARRIAPIVEERSKT